MSVNHYHHDDAGAPVLSGQAGALVALLDAVLVNGYGSKAGLGWTIAFSAPDKRVYRLDSTVNSGRYLRVDDTTTTYATITGYDAMTDIDTGTGRFPAAGDVYWRKSQTADATSRLWDVYGDEAFIHLFTRFHTASNRHEHVLFGDILSLGEAIGARTVLAGARTTSSVLDASSIPQFAASNVITSTTVGGAHCIPDDDGLPTAQTFRCCGHLGLGSDFTGALSNNGFAGADIVASRLWAYRPSASELWMMGEIPGMRMNWKPTAGTAYDSVHGTTIENMIGDGHDYRAQSRSYGNGTNAYHYALMDITGPWR